MKPIYLAFLCLLLCACGEEDIAPPPAPTEVSATYDAGLVKIGPLQTRTTGHEIICTGTIEVPPTDLISVHSRTSGQVSGLKYLPGDYVKKGAQLLRISTPELIQNQRIFLETKVQLATAKRALERQDILNAGDATTASTVDAARSQVDLLNATYAGLKQELQQYGIDVDRLESDGAFQSSVGVYAAGGGYVHSVTTNQGQMVSPTNELMQIAGTSHLHLELSVPSREAAAVRKGQRVRFALPFNDTRGVATVEKINPMVDAETATLNVHCHFGGELPEGLVPGLFINATILAGERTLTGLPLSGVVKEGERYFGYREVDGDMIKTLLPEARLVGDFVAFRPAGADGNWVTEGAYYLGE
ncbi:efflux RND transporter periplasmic adaptor subunit [Neolewinella antarctica]|uniref:Cobalt-zinc-cadmium efflux system membrane fusion protein n=1 Tax=Neolewinella antarctica TaxID=442734 RepID=A0ABX0XFD5_9BACT|nr:efflux RND transporter periplasmic adaptor subunit [Neolewinella antarctica]NJC28029.1 cobalt-zinc-cadmium efflux system membrane fusion protein [Neolewinella antarctica]